MGSATSERLIHTIGTKSKGNTIISLNAAIFFFDNGFSLETRMQIENSSTMNHASLISKRLVDGSFTAHEKVKDIHERKAQCCGSQ